MALLGHYPFPGGAKFINDLVGAQEQRRQHGEVERPGGRAVGVELQRGRMLH